MQHREKIHVSWLLAVFAGGFIGGILRYVISGVTHDGTTMMGTTIVNLSGTFLLAFTTYGLDMKFDLPEWLLLALGTGVIGGFTTFSTLMLDFSTLAPRHAIYATLLLMLNLLGGLLAATAGFLASKLVGRRDKKQW